MIFSDLIEGIKRLSWEEKQEVFMLLNQYLREEKREKIYDSFQESKQEELENKLIFSSNIDTLKSLMEEE